MAIDSADLLASFLSAFMVSSPSRSAMRWLSGHHQLTRTDDL